MNDLMKEAVELTATPWAGIVPLLIFFTLFVAAVAWTAYGAPKQAPPLE